MNWFNTENKYNHISQKIAWSVLQAVQFSVYFFAFLLAESMVNNRAAELMGADIVLPVYSVGLICTAFGYLCFGFFKNVLKSLESRKKAMITSGIGAAISAMGLIFAGSPGIVLLCSFGCLITFGYIGGFVHYSMDYTWGNKHLGKVIGISAGIAILLQFAVQNLRNEVMLFLFSILISSGIIIGIAVFSKYDWVLEDPLPYSQDNKTDVRKASVIIIATIIMTTILSFNDSLMVIKNAEHEVKLFAGARLFYAFGLFISGYISDIKDRKYLPIATLLAMLSSVIAAALLSDPVYYGLNMSLMYFYSGFYVMYFTLSAIVFAPTTHTPGLWSGIGRITRSLTAAAVVLLTSMIPESQNAFMIIICSCLLSMLLLVVFWVDSGRGLIPNSHVMEEKDPSVAPDNGLKDRSEKEDIKKPERANEENLISEFAKRHGLTPRETDVLILLVTTEDGTQEIADTMIISRRVLQRYITSIYEKTGTKTRVGLIRKVLMGEE